MRNYKILLIDQENITREMIDLALSSLDIKYQQTNVSNCTEAETTLRQDFFDLILAGHAPGDQNPLAIFQLIAELDCRTPVIILSSLSDPYLALDFFRAGAQDYLLTPCVADELATRLRIFFNKLTSEQKKMLPHDTATDKKIPVTDMQLTMAHDIRSPLLSMLAYLKHLSLGRFGKMAKGVTCEIDNIAERCYKLLDMADEYLADIHRMPTITDTGRHLPHDLVNDIIGPVLEELTDDIRGNNIVLNNIPAKAGLNETIYIKANAVELKTVFRNLFSNAIKYGGAGCTVGLNVRSDRNYYQFSVFNNGPAISENNRCKLFMINNKPQKDSRHGGAGVGLYLTKKIINRYGGEIWYDTVENRPHFFFTMPRPEKSCLPHGTATLALSLERQETVEPVIKDL